MLDSFPTQLNNKQLGNDQKSLPTIFITTAVNPEDKPFAMQNPEER